MRSDFFALSRDRALRLLDHAPSLQLASTRPDGKPVGGAVGFVVRDDALVLDGAASACVGRDAVLTWERVVATPPEGGATWREGVRVCGMLEPAGTSSVRMPLDRVEGESRLGQDLAPAARGAVLERLWARGLPGDPAAIEWIRDANPDTPTPAFLAGPAGATMACALDERDVRGAVELLADEYWNAELPREVVAAAQLGSCAWVGARDDAGGLIANARTISDRAKVAWIYDVVVQRDWRGRGLGQAVMRLLLDHPAVRGVRSALLDTRDAQRLYERFGFVDRASIRRPYPATQMVLKR